MASNEYSIGPRIKIEGAAEFKRSIKEINAEYRALRSEMGLVQQQFKGQETSEKSLTAQKANLTRQIELQKQKISETTEIMEKYSASENASKENIEKYKDMVNQSKTALEKLKHELDDVNKKLEKSNSNWGSFQKTMGDISQKTGAIGKSLSSVGGALTKGVTAPIVAVGGAAVAAAGEVNSGMNDIIKMTGATGKEAKSLEKAYKNAATNVAGSMEDISKAVGSVNQRFGFTGKQAQKASEDFMKFSKVTNTDVGEAVRLVSRAMGDANIPAKNYKKILDQLTVASQKTGVSVEDLTQNMTKYGAPMRQLGFTTSQTIAMFSQWEKAGVTTEKAFSGMRIAISGWMKEGKDAGTEFQKTVKGIQDGTISTNEAMEIFGKKGGPDMIDAIKQGRFNFGEFTKTLKESGGALNKTYNSSLSATDKLQIEMNKLKVAGAGAGTQILKSLLPSLTSVADSAAEAAAQFGKLPADVQTTIIKFLAIAAAAGPVTQGLGGVFNAVSKVTGAFKEGGVAANILQKIFPQLAVSATDAATKTTAAVAGASTAVEGATGATAGLSLSLGGVASAALPVAGAIGIIAAAVVDYKNRSAEAEKELGNVTSKTNDLINSTNQLISAQNSAKGSYQQTVADAQAQAASAKGLNDKLQELVKTQGGTEQGNKRIKATVDQLNQVVPGLNLQYNDQKNKLSQTNSQIKQHIDNMVKEAKASAQVQMLTEAYKRQYQQQQKQAQIESQLDSNKQKLNKLYERGNALMKDGGYQKHANELADINIKIGKLNGSDEKLIKKHGELDKSMRSNRAEARATEIMMEGGAKSYSEAYKKASEEIKKTSKDAKKAGKYTKQGFEQGLDAPKWATSAKQAGGNFISGLKKVLHIKSPSREMMEVAQFVNQGFEIGLAPDSWSQMGEQTGQSYLSGLSTTLTQKKTSAIASKATPLPASGTVQSAKTATSSSAASGAKSQTTQFTQIGVQSVKAYTTAITSQKSSATASGQNLAKNTSNGLNSQQNQLKTTGTNLAKSTNSGLLSQQNQLKTTGTNLAKNANAGLSSQNTQLRTTGANLGRSADTGVRSELPRFTVTGRNAGQNVVTGLRSEINQARNAGRDTGLSYNDGLKAEQRTIVGTTNNLVKAVKDAFVKGLGIHSPAHVTYEYGRYTGLGFINGLNSTELGKFTRSTVNDMKGAFKHNKFTAEANVNYLDDDTPKEVTWMRKYDGGSVVKGADGGKGARFISTMLGLVNDDSHGYSQANRWGPDYDCSSSIIYSLRKAGFDTGSASTTHNLSANLTARGWQRLPYKNPKKGDILLNDSKHVELSLGNGKNAGFHSAHGHPEPGDQAHEAYVGKDPGGWAAILRWKGGFGDSLADTIEEAYDFKKFGFGSMDAEGDGAVASGKLGDWVKLALEATGQPMSLKGGLIKAAKAESGGNPRAVNNWDINAKMGHPSKGLMQTIDSTFNHYKMKGHGNIWNPVDNMIAAIRYMIARYGSVQAVLKPRSKHWYGYAVGSRYIPYTMPAIVHQGEMIIPKSENPYANSKGSITGGLFSDGGEIADAINKMTRTVSAAMANAENPVINVYGAEGQDVDELADKVADVIIETSQWRGAMV